MNWDKIKLGWWSAVGGAAVLAFIGFRFGGWVTSSNAQEMLAEAVTDRLTPICVAQFNQDPEKDRKLVELKKADYDKKAAYVEKEGWATMPGEKKADANIAEECSRRLAY